MRPNPRLAAVAIVACLSAALLLPGVVPSAALAVDPHGSPAPTKTSAPPAGGHAILSDGSATAAGSTTTTGPALPSGFTAPVVLSGLSQPTNLRFAPDGSIWVTEKTGKILRYASLTATPTVFADLSAEVNSYWDRGLMGIALPPSFPTDPSVYVLYTYDHNPVSDYMSGAPASWNDSCPNPPGGTTDGCPVVGRISRLTASSGGSTWTGTETVLVQNWCQQWPSHSQDDLRFGPDGYLYATSGEGANFSAGDYGQFGGTTSPIVTPANPCGDPPNPAGTADAPPTAEGGALRAQSARRTDGPAVLNGSIIRINASTGAGAPGNPFAGSSDVNAQRILGYGLRNPYRFNFRPGHPDQVWVGDVGYNTWEEVDRVAVPASGGSISSTGNNFGWPCYEGNQAGTYYGGTALNLCTSLVSAGTATAPYYTYAHSAHISSTETCRTGSSAISGIAFYAGTAYPSKYRNAMFFADHSRDCIWAMLPNSAGDPDPTNIVPVVQGAASGFIVGPVDLETGPNGDIFYVDYDQGTINRIAYGQPQAEFTANPTSGAAPLTVALDGTSSVDPAGLGLTYQWTVTGATCTSLATATTSCTFPAGVWSVKLTVTDGNGVSNTSPATTIDSGGTGPAATINLVDGAAPPPQPPNPPPAVRPSGVPAFWSVGDTITFSGSGKDGQGNALPASDLSWQVVMHHCPSDCHTHIVQTFTGVSSGSFPAPDHSYPSFLEIQLTVTDSTGLTASSSIYLYPKTATLTIGSNPSGLVLTAGQYVGITAPATLTFIDKSAVSLAAATTQMLSGTGYVFGAWSDSGAATHTVTASNGASYTATYNVGAVRYGGPDRFAAAASISAHTFSPGVAVAYIANAWDMPDSLAGSAAAGTIKGPLLLVAATGPISPYTTAELTRLKPGKIIVLGGPVTISDAVMSALGAYAPSVVRYGGVDRFQAAATMSANTFLPGVSTAYIANAYGFPDALAGAAAAGTKKGPLLLVSATGPINSYTATELSRVKPQRIVVLGGSLTISAAVMSELQVFAPSVVRYGGVDRFQTAQIVSQNTFSPGVPVAYIANAYSYSDARPGGAAAGTIPGPILLVNATGAIDSYTAAELTRLKPHKIVVLGGPVTISDAVLFELTAYAAP